MRPVNLVPKDERRGEAAPLRAGAVSYAIVALLAIALVAMVGVVLTNNEISERNAKLASLETRQVQATQHAQDLEPYEQFASLAQSRSGTIASLANSRFDWERVLNELALVTPQAVWLDTLTGTVAPGVSLGDTGSTSIDGSITGPSLQITGCADSQTSVARFLAALRDIDGVTRVGMQQSSLGDAGTGTATQTGDSASSGAGGCQTRDFIAAFQVTVAFDAVPVSQYTSPSTEATPAATTAEMGAGSTAASDTTTDDGGVAATESEQQATADSATQQTEQASSQAATVGVGQ